MGHPCSKELVIATAYKQSVGQVAAALTPVERNEEWLGKVPPLKGFTFVTSQLAFEANQTTARTQK